MGIRIIGGVLGTFFIIGAIAIVCSGAEDLSVLEGLPVGLMLLGYALNGREDEALFEA